MAEPTWVWRDGARLTPWMKYQIERLDAAFYKQFGYHIIVSSGVRTAAEQTAIFLSRYVRAGDVRGRRVYDTRWWNGVLWYRVSSAGTVAVPNSPQANHQIRGTKGAVDIRDTGPDAGVMTATSKRGRWIRQNAAKYDLVAEGDGFNEGWHFAVLNVLKAPPGSGSGGGAVPLPPSKGKTVIYNRQDATARKSGRKVAKGQGFYLNVNLGEPASKASNIVGGIGDYSIVTHIYATGTPGDVVETVLLWDDVPTPGAHSRHYVARARVNEDGFVRAHIPSIRGVARGTAVYAYLLSPATNKGEITVTLFDTDALLHS